MADSELFKDDLDQLTGNVDEIVVIMRRVEVTLELMEQTLGLLLWQGMPWWRRLAAHWHHAREVIDQSEEDQTKWERAMAEKTAADNIGHDS